MIRIFQILGALILTAIGAGLWILRPVPPEQADTVDWDELQATILRPVLPEQADTVDWNELQATLQHPDKTPISSQTNVVLVMVCTLRKDRLEPYGLEQPTSPFLDVLADHSVVLDRHYTQAPWTRPSSGSLLTGRWPRALQLDNPGKRSSLTMVLEEHHTTLAEHLENAGYATIGSTGNPNLKSQFGLAQGLQTTWEPPDTFESGDIKIDGHYQVDFLLNALDDTPNNQPAYLQLMLTDAHRPRQITQRYMRLFTTKRVRPGRSKRVRPGRRAKYHTAIRKVDAVLARLFAEVQRRRPNTLFILTNDHGEGLRYPRNHGKGHGNHLYPTTIGGTSIWHHPAIEPARASALTMNLDVVPTILGALGLPQETPLDGVDLSGAMLLGQDWPNRPFVFSETFYGKSNKSTAISAQFQYIMNHRPSADPAKAEKLFAANDLLSEHNVIADQPVAAARHRDAIATWQSEMTTLWNQAGTPAEVDLSETTRAQLEALGYIE
jgi:arylsulfatase A-like enzyme